MIISNLKKRLMQRSDKPNQDVLSAMIIEFNKYRSLYESSPDLYRTIDTEGVILDCNKSYADALGYSKEEVIGITIFNHAADISLVALRSSFETWKETGHVSSREVWMRRKDGTTFPVSLSATNLYDEDGKLIGSNTTIRDITEVYEARKKLEDNERRIKEQFEELKKLDLLKDEFLAMVTHELKTPLVPIKGYVDMLLSEHIGPLNVSQRQKLEVVKNSTQCLLKIVYDLLEVQKIELGQLKLTKEMHDLSKIITDSIEKMRTDTNRYGITITTDLCTNLYCLCDSMRIEQIITNLLTNAIKFSPKDNGKIHVKLFREDNTHARIVVKDNGIGIEKDKLDKIFLKFYQTDTSLTREKGGSGLGLTISKGIVENHDGKIWAESEGRDKGTEIHIDLPCIASN